MKSMNNGSFANKPSNHTTKPSRKLKFSLHHHRSAFSVTLETTSLFLSSKTIATTTKSHITIATTPLVSHTTIATVSSLPPYNNDRNTMTTGTIVGLVFSTVCGIALFAFFIFFFIIRKKRRRHLNNSDQPPTISNKINYCNEEEKNTATIEEQPPIIYTITASFTQTLDDELYIQPGDRVQILNEYNDGWCLGKNLTRGGSTGVLPKNCLFDY